MSKDKKQADISPPKPTREKIKYQVEQTRDVHGCITIYASCALQGETRVDCGAPMDISDREYIRATLI